MLFKLLYLPQSHAVQIAVLAAVPCCSNCCICRSLMLFKLLYLPQSHAVQIAVFAAVPCCSNCCTCRSPMLFKLLYLPQSYAVQIAVLAAVPCCSNCCLLPQSHAVQTSSNVRHLTTYEIRNWCLIQFSACTIYAVYFFL